MIHTLRVKARLRKRPHSHRLPADIPAAFSMIIPSEAAGRQSRPGEKCGLSSPTRATSPPELQRVGEIEFCLARISQA